MRNQEAKDEMDELIRRSIQVEVPSDVEESLRRRLMEFRTRVEQRPPSRLPAFVYLLIQPTPVRILAMAAALLLAVVAATVLSPRNSGSSRAYAAAVEQLNGSQSLEYTIVLNDEPYVGVDFSYLAPGYRRFNCSWGIEARADRITGREIVLLHATRTYVMENGRNVEGMADSENIADQLRSLPLAADEVLGQQQAGNRALIGYRLRKGPPNGSISGLQELDVWIDAGTQAVHHVDITVQEEGKPVHRMHINNIHVGAELNRSLFDLTPPSGYTALPTGQAETRTAVPLRADIRQVGAQFAIVVPMTGPFQQTPAALQKVEAYLKTQGVTPIGHPFGRYRSEEHWDAGYPVPPGTRAEPPFALVPLPSGLTASVVVNGPWGNDFYGRWVSFLKSVGEQGYRSAGLPMLIWLGDQTMEQSQATEMRIPVTKAN